MMQTIDSGTAGLSLEALRAIVIIRGSGPLHIPPDLLRLFVGVASDVPIVVGVFLIKVVVRGPIVLRVFFIITLIVIDAVGFRR